MGVWWRLMAEPLIWKSFILCLVLLARPRMEELGLVGAAETAALNGLCLPLKAEPLRSEC